MAKEKLIKANLTKLRRFCKFLSDDRKALALDLAERLAFLQATLRELEADIAQNGITENFSQTPGVSYERERPCVRVYNQTLKNYAALTKQFAALLPPAETQRAEDELMAFIKQGMQPWRKGVEAR